MPLKACNTVLHISSWIGMASMSSSTFLFLFRASSVYHDNKHARAMLGFIWLISVLGTLVVPFSLTATSLQPNGLCAVASIKRLTILPSITTAIFDLIVYIMVSSRVASFHTSWGRYRAFFTVTDTSPISKTLLRTGQLYFLYVYFITYISRNFSDSMERM